MVKFPRVFTDPSKRARVENIVLGVVLLGLLGLCAYRFNRHLNFKHWLSFRYVGYWLVSLVPMVGALFVGTAIVDKLIGRKWSTPERMIVGLAIGVIAFGLGWTALGFLQLYNPVTFVVWPLTFLAIGVPHARRNMRSWLRLRARVARRQKGLSLVEQGLVVLGVFGVILIYASIMTPTNISYDARWYHLPIAERYAFEGGIQRFPEGWFLGGYPQLASHLYSWCFSIPKVTTFDRVELCAHFEFVLFLATLAGIPVLSRRLLPRRVHLPRFTWAVFFFFPGILVYDSNLNGGADHVAAFWAVPVFLATLRAMKYCRPRELLVFSLVASGVMNTKFTGYSAILGPGLGLGGRMLWLSWQRSRTDGARAALSQLGKWVACIGVPLVVLTTPYWLKNAIWYGNPVFPLASGLFKSRPWNDDALNRTIQITAGPWRAEHSWAGVQETLLRPFKLGFVPFDWWSFHRDWPMFGVLFTVLTPVLLFRRTKPLIGITLATALGVMFWYWTFHQDRYLQVIVPWAAAATTCFVALAWKVGWVARVGVIGLVGLQWLWGSDAAFLGTHTMAGQPIKATIDLLAQGFAGKKSERLVAYGDLEEIGRTLPKGSVVLRHETHMHLGIGVRTIGDWEQAGITWTDAPSPADVHKVLLDHGITHVMWAGVVKGFNSLGAEAIFYNYAARYAEAPKRFGGLSVAAVATGKLPTKPTKVLVASCDSKYKPGVYEASVLDELPHTVGNYFPGEKFPKPEKVLKSKEELGTAIDDVDVVVWGESCHKFSRSPSDAGFALITHRGKDSIFVRKK